MSDDGSINFGREDSLHIQSPALNNFSHFNTYKSNILKNSQPNTIRYINVLNANSSGKLVLNSEFQQFICTDNMTHSIAPVSFLGTKKIGKSFLLDNLIGLQTEDTRKVMSRNREQLINCPNLSFIANNGAKQIYFDCNEEPTPPIFSLLYYISSIIVYNMSPNNQNEENTFFLSLIGLLDNIRNQQNEVSKPKLIIVRRDTGSKQIFDFDLIRKIQQFQLFQPQINILHMPYPGNPKVKAKQLLDIPKKQLSPNFINEVRKLHSILKSAEAKFISNEALNSQSLSLAMQQLAKSINNQEKISTKKIMNHIYEDLSVGYYNNYLKLYSQELQKQFGADDPCDKYTIYKKLSKIKRRVSKKMGAFALNSNDPVFRKYVSKLEQTIKNKEVLVKSVNEAKSRDYHINHLKEISETLNKQNYEQLIDRYCKSNLDEQKAEVLLQNWQKIIKSKQVQNMPIKVSKPRISQPPAELLSINKQLQQIDKMIMLKSKAVQKPQSYESIKQSLQSKKAQLQCLRQEKQKIEGENAPKFILSSGLKNEQLSQLEEQKQKLRGEIQKYDREIERLTKLKESKLKETTARLHQQLIRQENNLKKIKESNIKQTPAKSKIIAAGKTTERTCCQLM